MKSIKPRKQRKMLYNAPLHKKRRWLSSHLAENLLLKYDKRSVPVITGDEVKVMRGSFKGHKEKVSLIRVKKQVVEVEGITTVKADGTKIAKPIHASNLLITKLNLTDRWRRQKLERGLSETTKKEIEKEAEEQIKELEEEQKISEEVLKEEEQETPEETIEEEVSEKKTPTEKTETKPKKETEKPKKTEEKTTGKKTEASKNKTAKKTSSKPKEKKKEGKA